MEAQYDIQADITKNRLYLMLGGYFNDELAIQAADITTTEVRKLKPGFSLISDISQLQPATPFVLEQIQRGQWAIAESGVKRIIRVVDKKNITAKMQFTRFGKKNYNSEIKTDTADSFAQAITILESENS